MGRMFVEDMQGLELGLPDMVAMHLRGNLYPPVPLTMVDACVEAIDACLEENYNKQIDLPEGVSYRGLTTAPAYAIIENHRLEAFLAVDDDDFEEFGE